MIKGISGTSSKNSITIRSSRWIATATRQEDKSISTAMLENNSPINCEIAFIRGIKMVLKDFNKGKYVIVIWAVINLILDTKKLYQMGIYTNFRTLYMALTILFFFIIASLSMKYTRTSLYHGAEHKVINAYLHGKEITKELVCQESRVCPRCGTNIILGILIIMIICSLLGIGVALALIIGASISYEFSRKFAYGIDNHNVVMMILYKILSVWQFLITTREPSVEEIEVGIVAFQALLRAENMGE